MNATLKSAGCGVDIIKKKNLFNLNYFQRLCSGDKANASTRDFPKLLIFNNIATVDLCILSNTLLKVKLLKTVFLISCLIARESLV